MKKPDSEGIPCVKFDQTTGKLVDLGVLDKEAFEQAFFEGMTMQNSRVRNDALIQLMQQHIITADQAQKLAKAFSGDLMQLFFVQGSQHNIGVRALVDKVLSADDLLSMPTKLHLDYLTAVRETYPKTPQRWRTFDGLGIILLRENLFTIDQYKQLPVGHLDALFNGHYGEGLYALRKQLITFEEIMQVPEEKFDPETRGALGELISQRNKDDYETKSQLANN